MKSKTKQCQNCKADFTIEPEDFEFYKKIDVPEPTFCPNCRAQRRLIWRNENNLYKRKCDLTGKDIFSQFTPESKNKVYERDVWWSDQWNPMKYGKDYDFNKPFLEQFKELLEEVPWPSRLVTDLVNSDYSMNASFLKNCYLIFDSSNGENCAFGVALNNVKDSYDGYSLEKCELCYQGFNLTSCYKTFFSSHCTDCQEIYFCHNCIDCSNCFGCSNLRHKKYHIFNESYSKEEYFKKLKEFDLGSYKKILSLNKETREFWLKHPVKFMHGRKNDNVTGEYIDNSKDVKNSYMVKGSENLKYCHLVWFNTQDCYDYFCWGDNARLIYEGTVVGSGVSQLKFCFSAWECRNLEYCINSINSHDLFGCSGLQHKQYCILNKQYSKEEYFKMIGKIKKNMDDMPYIDKKERVYKYGEFFPSELSPLDYNSTIANEYYPLAKEEALKQGYSWYNKPKSEHQPTIKAIDLPDNIKDVDDKILKEVIECSSPDCSGSNAFRIIPQELEFYQKMNLPLPRLCPDCRYEERIKQRNPLNFWHRTCMKKGCNTEFETSYAPDRKETVYCEKCYQEELN